MSGTLCARRRDAGSRGRELVPLSRNREKEKWCRYDRGNKFAITISPVFPSRNARASRITHVTSIRPDIRVSITFGCERTCHVFTVHLAVTTCTCGCTGPTNRRNCSRSSCKADKHLSIGESTREFTRESTGLSWFLRNSNYRRFICTFVDSDVPTLIQIGRLFFIGINVL